MSFLYSILKSPLCPLTKKSGKRLDDNSLLQRPSRSREHSMVVKRTLDLSESTQIRGDEGFNHLISGFVSYEIHSRFLKRCSSLTQKL